MPRYEPMKPSLFVCQPAAALIAFSNGQVELFSKDKKCNMRVFDYAKFSSSGQTLDLLDNQLILIGANKTGSRWTYISVQDPRDGLLAVKFTRESSPIPGSPHRHTSFTEGNKLTVLGGDQKARARLDTNTWSGINLRWKNNGSTFTQHTLGACSLKMLRDCALLIGGFDNGKATNNVFRMNMTEETVEELSRIRLKRAFHSCEVTSSGEILISGGTEKNFKENVTNMLILPDELYSTTTEKSLLLDETVSIGRYQHRLIRLEDSIFGMGGKTSNGSEPSIVKVFNMTTLSWEKYSEHLKSSDTGELAVTPFPLSSVDCVADCVCGVKAQTRIVNGKETQVNQKI